MQKLRFVFTIIKLSQQFILSNQYIFSNTANLKKFERKVANRFYDCIHEKPEILNLIYEKLCIKFPNLNGTTIIPTVDNSVTENYLNNELETDDNDD